MTIPVYFTQEICDRIMYIKNRNQHNPEAKSQWKDYLLWILKYLSNPSIAFDYAGRFVQDEDGIIFFDSFGYSLDFIVKIDKETTQAYVSIINIDLNLEEFGLVESKQRKNTLIITETKLRRIIAEYIRRVLYN